MCLSHDPEIPLQSIYPREIDLYFHKKTGTIMFIAASYMIAKSGNDQQVPSTEEWIYIHCDIFTQWNTEPLINKQTNKILMCTTIQMNITDTRLNTRLKNKQNQQVSGRWLPLEEGQIGKEHEGISRVLPKSWVVVPMGAHICNNSSSCKLLTCALYCVSRL